MKCCVIVLPPIVQVLLEMRSCRNAPGCLGRPVEIPKALKRKDINEIAIMVNDFMSPITELIDVLQEICAQSISENVSIKVVCRNHRCSRLIKEVMKDSVGVIVKPEAFSGYD